MCHYCLKPGHVKAHCWIRDLDRRPYHQRIKTDKIKCIQCGFLHRIGTCTVTTDAEIADLVMTRRQPEKDNKDGNKDEQYEFCAYHLGSNYQPQLTTKLWQRLELPETSRRTTRETTTTQTTMRNQRPKQPEFWTKIYRPRLHQTPGKKYETPGWKN